jgi:hypothetical protein
MIDGTTCYSVMNDTEKLRWKDEVIKGGKAFMTFLFNKKYYTFDEFIRCSFLWDGTKHGHDYWYGISTKYVLHDILSPPNKFNSIPPEIF